MALSRNKPTPGHKFGGIRHMAQATCECGWEGARWIGKGSTAEAHKEWRWHIDKAHKEQGQ